MYKVRRQKGMPSPTWRTAFIPEKGGISTPLNLDFVESCIVQFVGGLFVFVLWVFFFF